MYSNKTPRIDQTCRDLPSMSAAFLNDIRQQLRSRLRRAIPVSAAGEKLSKYCKISMARGLEASAGTLEPSCTCVLDPFKVKASETKGETSKPLCEKAVAVKKAHKILVGHAGCWVEGGFKVCSSTASWYRRQLWY